MISIDVGFEIGKQIHGRQRFVTVDLLSLVLRVLGTEASLPEGAGAKDALKRVYQIFYILNRTAWHSCIHCIVGVLHNRYTQAHFYSFQSCRAIIENSR
jgi:hypothetical protein